MLRVSPPSRSSCSGNAKNRFRYCAVLLTFLPLGGCIGSPLATRTAAFSTAAASTITQTQNAYQLVNQVYEDMQAARLVANFEQASFDPEKFKPFIPDEDLAIRTSVLNGLQQYATLLAEISGNQPIAEIETQSKAVGDALVQLHADDFKGLKVSPDEKQIAATAVAAIGGVLIEHERARKLPKILDKMNQPVQNICLVLQHDIGTPDTPGLADALHRAYQREIDAQQDFLRNYLKSMSVEDKRREIEMLPRLLTAQKDGDRILAKTSKSLADLAAAHAALASTKSSKDAPAFRLKLSELIQDANTLSSFYDSLNKK